MPTWKKLWIHQDNGKTINKASLQLPKTIAQLGNTDDPLVAKLVPPYGNPVSERFSLFLDKTRKKRLVTIRVHTST